MKTNLFLLLFFVSFTPLFSQQKVDTNPRISISINKDWQFAKDPSAKGSSQLKYAKVTIPHTWNAFDVLDDVPGYYRGVGYYRKKLALSASCKNKQIYLELGAANQEATVLLNGKTIGSHKGGYTGFLLPLNHLKFDGNDELIIKVDNSYNEHIPPLTGDFTFFGGIYRDVKLIMVSKTHFVDEQYGTAGLYVSTSNVSDQKATMKISGRLHYSTEYKKVLLTSNILDANGKNIATATSTVEANKNQLLEFELPQIQINNPQLWSPENPYLYQVVSKITDAQTGQLLDEVKTHIGLRYFSFDAEKGFFLNGKSVKLIGASRHQDFAKMGNAVPASLQVKDVELLKAMGGNYLRVAHYPQDQAVINACDRLGVLASVEIPVVNEITESQAFYDNCKHMQLEMIKQNYNHPSVIIWAYMNEVLLKMHFGKEPERKKIYLKNVENLVKELEDLTRKTDPSRYTMIANHGDVNGYTNAGLVKIPMIVGWNLYQGWYGGKIEDFGPGLDRIHAAMPDKPIIVTEYGADVDPRIDADEPIRFDKSLAYGIKYHQGYLSDIKKRPFVAGAAVWNLADFSSETRMETMPSINNKGLLTLDRQPKNTYFLYKANFSKYPYLKIGDGTWKNRSAFTSKQNISVMSNLDSVTLVVNGKRLLQQAVIAHVANWEVTLKSGKNIIEAIGNQNGKVFHDQSAINFALQPQSFYNGETSLNLLMGSRRQFIDDENQIWLPSPSHQTNDLGSNGGEAFKIKNSGRQQYGSDKDINGTQNDPIYQTQLVGINGYFLPTTKGKYEVTLHFAELMGNGIQNVLPYNLDSLIAEGKELPPQRIFDVYMNDKLIIKNLNVAAKYGVAKAVKMKFTCILTDDKGIRLSFKPIAGQPILNALQVKKMN